MSEDLARLLEEGIAAARAGEKSRARRLLLEATERDEQNEQAWFWLSGVVDDPEEARICLENVLAINPAHERARQGLAWLQNRLAARHESEPPPPPPPPPEPPPWSRTPPSIEEQLVAPTVPAFVSEPDEEEEELAPPAHRTPCPACGSLNYDFADKCVKCSFPLTIACVNCGEIVPTDTGLCSHCGADLPLPRKLGAVREREGKMEEDFRQALTYMEDERYHEAREVLQTLLKANPGHIEALHNLGLACARLGLAEEAREHWEEVQRLQPDYPSIDEDMESLLSPRERRALSRQKKKRAPRTRKERQAEKKGPPAGQALMYEWEKPEDKPKPVPEEEMSGLEVFLYVLMAGLVIGVAYALNRPSTEAGFSPDRIMLILKQSGVVIVLLLVLWLLLGLLTRLLSLVFKGKGRTGGYMAAASSFVMPFFLLILPIVLSIPQLVALLPETIQPWLRGFPPDSALASMPPPPWLIVGGLALFWGLFNLARGISRVGRMALWKGLLVGLVALALAAAIVGGLAYFGYGLAEHLGYLETLGLGPEMAPSPTPEP